MPGESKVVRVIGKEIGKKLAAMMSKKAGSRLLGHLLRDSKVWKKAFGHIALHFKPMAGKPAHAVFEPKFRSMAAMKELIGKAVNKLGRSPVATKLTIDGVPLGKPAVILEKEFAEVIGRAGEKELKILRIVVDYTGRLITAYPVDKFFAGTVSAVVVGSASSASASEIPRPVQEAYTGEAEAAQGRIDQACAPKGILESVLDFLIDPACIALEPQEMISDADLKARVDAAIARVEVQLGTTLDYETRQHIRDDIGKLWGRYSPDGE